jgi:succinoglycan biosynthesis transport protein ExoP
MNRHSLDRHSLERELEGPLASTARLGHQPFPTNAAPETESLLEEYLHTFGRHKKLIALCALAGLLAALLLELRTLPVYRTRTSLDIRSLNSDFMNMRSVDPTGNGSSEDVNTNLQTQIKLLQSDALLEQVTQNLLTAPHPDYIQRDDLVSRFVRLLHVGSGGTIPFTALIEDAVQRVKVKPLGLTRLVEVTCDSYNPQFSARFCNTLTQTFETQDLQTRSVEAQKTQDWLTHQVADVRQRAEESQKKLEAAVGGNGLMLSQTTTTAGEDRLRALQEELVKAQADRMAKEATSSVAQTAPAETMPDVQDNPAHRAYELKLADLRSQLTQLVPTFTEQNPKVVRLRAQIAEAEAGLRTTASSSTNRQSNEYSAARHREELLNIAFKAQQAVVSSDLQKAAQVTLLRREMDSEQQLYQTLLQRAKEAGFAAAMQATTIRVIDSAKSPRLPFTPRRALASGVGFFLGGLLGIGLAFYKDRNNNVFNIPGDIQRLLNLNELGVIPSAQRLPVSPATAFAQRSNLSRVEPHGPAIALTRWNDNFSISAEAYRNATLSILLSDSSKRTRSYVVSSPNVGEGKTTVTSNIGIALSKSRLRVVLIDGDLRRPALHTAFSVPNDSGLRNILRGEVDLETTPAGILTCPTGIPNVSLIPAGVGSEDVVELLHSSYFGALLARLSRDFDIVLVDSPPVLHMADARILAGQSDGAILILRAGSTTHEQASQARDMFDHDGVRLVGTILNDFDPAAQGKPDYYSSYYRYGASDPASAKMGIGA